MWHTSCSCFRECTNVIQVVRDLATRIVRARATCHSHAAERRPAERHPFETLPERDRDGRERDAIDARTTATATRELTSAARAAEDPRAPRAAGIALFATPEGCVALASPPQFVPLVTIGPRFYILPLVPCTTPEPAVFVLALSRHSVRLIERVDRAEARAGHPASFKRRP